jgi:hypothetical protein
MSNMRINSTNTTATSPQGAESAESAKPSTASSNNQEPQLMQPEEKATPAEIGRQTFEAFLGGNIRSAELNAQIPETEPSASELQQPNVIFPDGLNIEQNPNLESTEAALASIPEAPSPEEPALDFHSKHPSPTAWPPPQDWEPGKTY